MNEPSPLYRPEALSYQRDDSFGKVILNSPFLLKWSTVISGILIICVFSFLFIGSYTKKSTLKGQLLPEQGVIKVYPPIKSKVLEKKAKNGTQVKKGDVLYILTSERNSTHGDTNKLIIERLESQINTLTSEHKSIKKQFDEYNLSIDNQYNEIQKSINSLGMRFKTQNSKLEILGRELSRYEILSKRGIVSPSFLEQQKTKLLDQKDVLDTLNLQKESLQQQQLSLLSDKAEKKNIYTSQISQLIQTITSLKNELNQYESNREIVIRSPIDGTITNSLAEKGQSIDTEKTLLSIIPSKSILEAILYAPSTDIGFIRKGKNVLIRYDAFPYEKFGQYKGIVSSISYAAINYDESSEKYFFSEYKGKPLYIIKVKLLQQSVTTYGHKSHLLPGMQLEADILTEKRKIYEWLLEPFFSVTGRY